VLAWQWLTVIARNPYFPPPLVILREAGRLWFSGPSSRLGLTGEVVDDVLPGLARVAAGWGIAAVAGAGIGVAIGRSRLFAGRGLLAFARVAVPVAAVAVLLLHVSPLWEVVTIAAGSVWPVLLGAADGAHTIDPMTVDVATVFRVPWYHRWYGVIVPAAAPKIIAGLRAGLVPAFALMVVAELAGGVGHRLIFVPGGADLPGAWAWLVLVGLLGYLAAGLLSAAERRALRWCQH
jgi:ABC-type nitrate/sulfonate/bicarbonate transport system permease component